MKHEEGRLVFRDRQLKLLIDGELKVTMTEDSMKVMINLLPDHFFGDILKTYTNWLSDNGYDALTSEELLFVQDVVNRQVRVLNEQNKTAQNNIRR